MPTSDILLESRADIISSTTIEGLLYGLTFTLYILCVRSLYLQLKDPDRRKQNLITLLYMSLVMLCGLLSLAPDSLQAQESYIDHANYPGGSFFYPLEVFDTLPIAIMGFSVSPLLDILTFGIQVWRLWVVWQTSWYAFIIVMIPTLFLLAYTALMVATTVILEARLEITDRVIDLIVSTSEGLQLSITVFVTLLITIKLVMVRNKHIRSMGRSETSGQYTSIVSMLVESYVLESVWITAAITIQPLDSNPMALSASLYLLSGQPFIQVSRTANFIIRALAQRQVFWQILSYLLVIYRVTTGRGWQKDTEEKLTSLQWNRGQELRTTQLSTQTSTSALHEEV